MIKLKMKNFAVGTLKDRFIRAAFGDCFRKLKIVVVIVVIGKTINGLFASRVAIWENKSLNERREKRNISIQRVTALFSDNIVKLIGDSKAGQLRVFLPAWIES